jgi:sec-independent protein translocase protein TatA
MLAEIFGVDGVIVLIVVVVLLFGGAAIPKLARNLGSAKNEFEKGLDEGKKASSNSNLAASNGTSEAAEAPAPAPSPVADDPTSRS